MQWYCIKGTKVRNKATNEVLEIGDARIVGERFTGTDVIYPDGTKKFYGSQEFFDRFDHMGSAEKEADQKPAENPIGKESCLRLSSGSFIIIPEVTMDEISRNKRFLQGVLEHTGGAFLQESTASPYGWEIWAGPRRNWRMLPGDTFRVETQLVPHNSGPVNLTPENNPFWESRNYDLLVRVGGLEGSYPEEVPVRERVGYNIKNGFKAPFGSTLEVPKGTYGQLYKELPETLRAAGEIGD